MASPNTEALRKALPQRVMFDMRCSHCERMRPIHRALLWPPHDADVRRRKYPLAPPYRMDIEPSWCICGGRNRQVRRAAAK